MTPYVELLISYSKCQATKSNAIWFMFVGNYDTPSHDTIKDL